ncbi:MAG: hypothetical protein AAF441_02720 [Pseudomonadota bacterium]
MSAEELRLEESFGAFCNDVYFGSDGGGIGGCIDMAARLSNDWHFALGVFQAGPESKSSSRYAQDPLTDRGRLALRAGKRLSTPWFEAIAAVRLGGEGGFIDDLTYDVRKELHGAFGMGTRPQRGDHGLDGIIGVSGHIWKDIALDEHGGVKSVLSPYAHGSAGTDNTEAGAGFMLGFQPGYAYAPIAKAEPQTGTYVPFFGGDGFGIFAAVRGVGHDTLYGGRARHFLAEAGISAQVTVSDMVRSTVLASCTTRPYDGAHASDCKATLRIGILY